MPGWKNARDFTLTDLAIRSTDDSEAYAYVGANHSLYVDAELTGLLCRVVRTGADAWSVENDAGAAIGTITRRRPTRRFLRPNWQLDQPGRAPVVGRTDWLTAKPGRLAVKAVARMITAVLDGLTGIGDGPPRSRTLEWRTPTELVMITEAAHLTVTTDWLDRRLAFAYSLLAR